MINEILFQLVLFLSNTIQAITGFAGTMLAMPFSIRLIGVENAKTVLNVFTIMACTVIVVQNRKYVNKKVLFRMVFVMLIGMALGVWLFEKLPTDCLLFGYAWLVIMIALKKMFWKKEMKLPHAAMLVVLIVAGIIHGMFLSGGSLLVIYAVTVMKDKDEFRSTMAAVWIVLNGLLVVVHARSGCYTPETVRMIICSMIALFLSVRIGNYLYQRINQKNFLKITYILLFLSGVSLLI